MLRSRPRLRPHWRPGVKVPPPPSCTLAPGEQMRLLGLVPPPPAPPFPGCCGRHKTSLQRSALLGDR